VYKVLVGKLKGKRPLGRVKHRWEDRIKIDLGEIDCSVCACACVYVCVCVCE
jgi:hypothetical protein